MFDEQKLITSGGVQTAKKRREIVISDKGAEEVEENVIGVTSNGKTAVQQEKFKNDNKEEPPRKDYIDFGGSESINPNLTTSSR